MAKTIVGLYDNRRTAEQVEDALNDMDFDTGRVHLITHDESGITHGFGDEYDDLTDALSDRGVPEDEAMLYAEGVRRGGNLVYARVDDDRVQEVAMLMNRYRPVDIEERRGLWKKQGFTGYQRESKPYTSKEVRTERDRLGIEEEETIPIAEEEMKIGKREVSRGGVRVHTHVVEQPIEEEVRVRDESVDVERRTTDRKLNKAEADAAFQEKTVEMSETDEEVVAEKTARQTGEVVVQKGAQEKTEVVRDTVRKTEVDVDKTGATGAGRFEDYRDTFRTHYTGTFGNEREFSAYEPAYRHGFTYGLDEEYRDRAYADVEPELRRSYEERHGKGTFNQVKEAIRHAYNTTRSGVRSRTVS